MRIDISKLTNITVGDACLSDYPDFSDAYIESAEYKGKQLTDDELEWLADNGGADLAQENAFESLLD